MNGVPAPSTIISKLTALSQFVGDWVIETEVNPPAPLTIVDVLSWHKLASWTKIGKLPAVTPVKVNEVEDVVVDSVAAE